MVQLMAPANDKMPVKLEIDDSLEGEHAPHFKRSRPNHRERSGDNGVSVSTSQYNPLDEPSPLGLRLRKSPSLLELIQMKLAHGVSPTIAGADQRENLNHDRDKKEMKGNAGVGTTTDKLKASNFPASILRIGSWEYKSRYEGDLVGKCYFAKHKLVWEVLEGGLKSKIEIQWSDIMGLNANCPDDGPGTLNIVLARQPLFFKETNPQPRKHTLWQATSDFTDGQASRHRQHFLQCPQGLLNKNFEKLIQCDTRLCFLSQQPEIVLDSPYFELQPSLFEDQGEANGHGLDQLPSVKGPSISGFQDIASPSASQSSSLRTDQQDSVGMTAEHRYKEARSPSSVMNARSIEANGNSEVVDSRGPINWDQIKLPVLHTSMSMSDFMSHIGNCISEQMTSENPPSADQQSEYQDILEDIAQYLLSDNQITAADESHETSLMSRVNSLCCLLQKDPTSLQNSQVEVEGIDGERDNKLTPSGTSVACIQAPEEDMNDGYGEKRASGMSRKDSFGELLFHLPRIASLPSLPKVLFNISEDCESQGR